MSLPSASLLQRASPAAKATSSPNSTHTRERFGDCLKVHQTQKRHVLSCRFPPPLSFRGLRLRRKRLTPPNSTLARERFGDCLKVHQTQKRHVLSCRFASIHAPSEGFACGESDFVAELYASRERFGDCLKVHQTQKRHVLSCRFCVWCTFRDSNSGPTD